MKIFIGYEEKYPVSYEVCKASITRFTDEHDIQPLDKKKLQESKDYWRPFQGESTDFAFTRFLVPYLCDYKDYALFCDGDFMWRCNPAEILEYSSPSVSVVKHPELITRESIKMDGKVNRPYPFKYWSSLMLFNNENCKKLDPWQVSKAPAGWLHGFSWTDSVGNIPATFNNMINYYTIFNPKAVHFTDGGPWLEGYEEQPYADEWRAILANLNE